MLPVHETELVPMLVAYNYQHKEDAAIVGER